MAVTKDQEISATDLAAGKLVFAPVANANGTAYATLGFQVRDSGGTANGGVDLDPTANTLTFNVVAVNDPPTLTLPSAQTVREDQTLALSGLAVGDPESALASVALSVGNGTLSVTLASGASIGVGANGSAELVLTGTLAAVNALLQTLTYKGNADFNGADRLTVTATDAGGLQAAGAVPITVTSVSDAP